MLKGSFGVVCCGKMDPQNRSAPLFCECVVKYAAEQKQGLAAPLRIAPKNHFVLF